MYLHGGGWVIGNLQSHDRLCRSLANQARLCVIAVDYRLAPEHPYPAALDDSVAAWRWVLAPADSLGIERGRVGIGGDSAGGNPAAVVALMGRDGTLPRPIDHYTPNAQDRLDWRASPAMAATLAGAPPALVVTVAHDPLCGEGRDPAARLEADGVRVTALHLGDHMHGMLMHGNLIRASRRIVDFIAAAVGAELHSGEPPSDLQSRSGPS